MTIALPGVVAIPPWGPNDLPSLRAAYSDRTASLMAYLAGFAYDPQIEVDPPVLPPELSRLGFSRITSFHNGYTNGWAYIVEGSDIIVLAFRGTASQRDWDKDFAYRREPAGP
jgi:hypothetical protein